jgi:hypothetical protein
LSSEKPEQAKSNRKFTLSEPEFAEFMNLYSTKFFVMAKSRNENFLSDIFCLLENQFVHIDYRKPISQIYNSFCKINGLPVIRGGIKSSSKISRMAYFQKQGFFYLRITPVVKQHICKYTKISKTIRPSPLNASVNCSSMKEAILFNHHGTPDKEGKIHVTNSFYYIT